MKKTTATLFTILWMSSSIAANVEKHMIPVFKGEQLKVRIETAPEYGCKKALKMNRIQDRIEISKIKESNDIPCDFPVHTSSKINFKLMNEWAMDYDIELLVPAGSHIELER
tara:strand:- start:400434 stop:400769 length:336 start_codon:yes stop_codon:yes gene_type:complete